MKLLILYGTTDGHTHKICDFLCDEARGKGIMTDIYNVDDNPTLPEDYDRIILASSVRAGKYHKNILKYVEQHAEVLDRKHTSFLSVSLTAAGHDSKAWTNLKSITQSFLDVSGWQPEEVDYSAGALLYTQYDFFERLVLRSISKKGGGPTDISKNYEFTNWNRMEAFINEIVNEHEQNTRLQMAG